MEKSINEASEDSGLYVKYLTLIKNFAATSCYFSEEEEFVLSHQDFVMKNILIKDGQIMAVLDWEWAGPAPKEIEQLSGMDFIQTPEDRDYFCSILKQKGCSDFFNPTSSHRAHLYKLLGSTFSLVAYREWFTGKLSHTAKFMDQKFLQRRVREGNFASPLELSSYINQELDELFKSFLVDKQENKLN